MKYDKVRSKKRDDGTHGEEKDQRKEEPSRKREREGGEFGKRERDSETERKMKRG